MGSVKGDASPALGFHCPGYTTPNTLQSVWESGINGNTLQLPLKQLHKRALQQEFNNLLQIKRKQHNDVIQTVHKTPNTKINVRSTWYTAAK